MNYASISYGVRAPLSLCFIWKHNSFQISADKLVLNIHKSFGFLSATQREISDIVIYFFNYLNTIS